MQQFFDITEEKLVTFHKFGEVCVMLGYKVDNLQDQLKETKIWKNLCLPMDRALSCAEKKRPHAFEEWGTKDVQALEKFYSNRLDSILRSIENRLKKLVDKKLPN